MIEYVLLGPIDARVEGRSVDLGGARQRAVLAALLVERNRVVSAERLIEAVWGENPPPTAETALQGHVSKLRGVLGRDTIRTERPGYVLEVPPGAVDVDRLEEAIRTARDAADETAAATLRQLLATAGKTPLDGIEIGPVGTAEIQRLEQLRLTGLETLLDVELRLGRTDAVLADAERLVSEHPYHERFHALRMVALYRAGRQADALAAYGAAREALDDSLGIDPGPELQELERRILLQDPDLDAPAGRPGSNLPSPPTALLGRAPLLEAIATTIDGGSRIVTLTGPGGTGKTRLSIAAASQLRERFAAGPYWVPCAALTEPALVLDAIASVVGGRGSLADRIGAARMLLVVDNLEQVLGVAADLWQLVTACPNLVLLVTSRERLAVRGEHEIPVPVLPLDAAVALFAERSRQALDAAVRDLCQSLDSLPLAIELAAARTKALTPAQILARLGDRLDFLKGGPDLDPRQQTLRRTIEWSHELLTPEERRLFRAMAAFPAGATLEAAVDVLGAELDALEALVAKSLLVAEGGRFTMLETIRAYGLDQLDASGERAAVEGRIAAWGLDVLVREDSRLRGPGQVEALARLDAELETLRLAFHTLVGTGDVDAAGRFVPAAAWWMRRRGRSGELLAWIREALALPGGDPARRAWLLHEEIATVFDVEPATDARPRIDAALAMAEELGDRTLIASLLEQRGVIPPYDDAVLERAAAIFTELGQENHRNRVLINLGSIALNDGRFETAAERCLAALALVRETGNDHGIGVTLLNLGSALMALDRDAEAFAALDEALDALARVDDRVGVAGALQLGAALLARSGDVERAGRIGAAAAMEMRRIGAEPDANDRRVRDTFEAALPARDGTVDAAADVPPPSPAVALTLLREALGTRSAPAAYHRPG